MQNIPLIAQHLQAISHRITHNYHFDKDLCINLTANGEIACARAQKPYTNAQTPGHLIPAGYTPSGKYKPSRFSPSKMDKRVGK